MSDKFALEKEQILSQYILHHEVSDEEVSQLAERLDRVIDYADSFHKGQKRKDGQEYIIHPVHTAMEVSRFGRIVDWAAIEASVLHDVLEDTEVGEEKLKSDYPESFGLVDALTKIRDSKVLTYSKLFSFVLEDIRVLLVKIADRLDNLKTLNVFSREKQVRIAKESAEMYANICKRLCMLDLAARFEEKIALYLHPVEFNAFRDKIDKIKTTQADTIERFNKKLAEIFPGDISTRIDIKWNTHDIRAKHVFTVCVITNNLEDAYRAMGRVHIAFHALPGDFSDTISNPRNNGFKALETTIAFEKLFVRFYLTSREADRFNRLGLLSMDIDSPEFNLKYLEDLRDLLETTDGNIQDFLSFQIPDAIQVTSPRGKIFHLEEGATALDFAFAVHADLGLRAVSAKIFDKEVSLGTVLSHGDRVEIIAAHEPACDERCLELAHTRKALAQLRRYLKKQRLARAATTGRDWYLEAAEQANIPREEALYNLARWADANKLSVNEVYGEICLGKIEIESILKIPETPKPLPMIGLVDLLRPKPQKPTRKVRRYEFDDPHIRFCPYCIPIMGDHIDGVSGEEHLEVHRRGCPKTADAQLLPLRWDNSKETDMRDPGTIEMSVELLPEPRAFYEVVEPFRNQGLDIQTIRMPGEDRILKLTFKPGVARTLDRLIQAIRKSPMVKSIRLMRAQG